MRRLLIPLLLFACWSCANIVPPKGGAVDEIPPQLKKSNPKMNTVYFNEGGFQLEFDEIIVLDNVNSQLIVSPPMKEKPDVRAMKHKVTVKFDKDDLQDNTTYSFNFGMAIKDFNNGNVLKNFKYVFSTGSYIDSLSISGTVFDAFTEEPVDNVAVLLYRNLSDTMPLTSLPSYFGISDEAGNYTISNIKNGVYQLFALLDMNQNYIYDLPNERIAFMNQAIEIDSSFGGVDFNLFTEENEKQFVSEQDIETYGRVTYVFNKPLTDYNIILKDEVFDANEYQHKLYTNRDTLKIWFPDYKDTFTVIIKQDSLFSDTTELEIEPVFSIDEMPPFKITPNLSGTIDLNKTLILKFENPITEWNPSFMSLYEDSLEVEIESYFNDSTKTELVLPYEWKEKSKYLLVFGLGSFVDFYDQKNDVYELRFGAQEENFYGKLNILIDIGETQPPYIFQLLNSEMNVLKEQSIDQSETISYQYLRPAEYSFRLIQDLNNNGKWDTGNYEEKVQPEPVIYYPTKTNVRSNWELDLEWGIDMEIDME